MSDSSLKLPIESSFDPRGTDAALAALRQLQQAQAAQAKVGPAGGGGAASFQAAGQAATQAEKDTLRYASAMASAQRATGDLSGAVETHRAALSQMTPNTIEAHQATTRLAQSQTALQKELSGSAGYAQQFGQAMGSSLMSIVGPAALAAGAIAAIGKAGELAQLGAQAQQTRARFDQLAVSAHTTGDAMLASLRKSSGGTISDTALQLDAMKASILGVATSAEQMGPLLAIARDRAQQMGISVEFAFDSLVTGLGRGSRLILDNIGVMVKEGAVNEAYATSVGKTVGQLTDQEKKQALVNEVLRQGNETIAKTGGAIESTAADFARLGAASDNARTAVGGLLATLLKLPARVATDVLVTVSGNLDVLANSDKQLEQFGARAVEVSQNYEQYGQKMAFINEQLAPMGASLNSLSESQFTYAKSLTTSGQSADQATAAAFKNRDAIMAADAATTDWGVSSSVLVNQITTLAGSSDGARMGAESLVAAYNAGAINGETFTTALAGLAAAQNQATVAADVHGGSIGAEIDMAIQAQAAITAQAQATADAATQSQIDTQAKQAQTAQTQLLEAQTNAAVDAFMALHPNISASGVASLVAAGQITPLLGQLIQATIRAREAAGALAYFNAMQGLKTINVAANLTGANSARSEVEGFKRSVTADNLAKEQKAYQDNAKAVAEAKRDQVLAVGSHNDQIKQREADLAAAERLYGAQSAQAIRARTALEQEEAQKQRVAGGGGRVGGGTGGAAARAAEATGNRLEDIARTSGQKLAAIDVSTQEKLAAIDAKAATERLRIARKLSDDIAQANADTNVEQQLNDFDKFQKDLTDDQKTALAEREAAEVHYNEKVAAAQAEAQQMAADGDAQLASDILDAKEKQAKTEQEIEEKAAKAKREGGKGQAAAVDAEAREATAAAQHQADTEIAIAQGKAQDRAAAETDEKNKVIAEAEDQKNKVITSAEGQLAGVKKASDTQKSVVVANLRAQAQAAERWASDTEAAAARAQAAMVGVTGPTPSPPTDGESENTGATPTEGAATERGRPQGMALETAGGMAAGFTGGGGLEQATAIIQEASQIIIIIAQTVRTDKHLLSLLNQYAQILANATTVLTNIADLRARLAMPQPPLDLVAVQQLANEQAAVVALIAGSINPAIFSASKLMQKYKDGATSAIDILNAVLGLRESVAKTGGPIDPALIGQLAAEAAQVASIVISQLVKLSDAEVAGLKRYADGSSAAIGILNDVMDLAKAAGEVLPPIPRGTFERLADLAGLAVHIILTRMLPTSQATADALSRYQESAGAAVAILKDMGDLARGAAEPIPPIPVGSLERLADLAGLAVHIITHRLLPQSDEQVAAIKRYQESTGAAIGVLKDTLDLPAKLFTDYQSPTDAQITRVVRDADRIARQINTAAKAYDTKGLDAAKAFSDAIGGTFSAFKDGLLFFQALNSGDFVLDPKNLARFEAAMGKTIAMAGRLGKLSAAIPPANIKSLQDTAGALSASYDSMIRLAAVPFGNLGGLTRGLGGNTTNVFNNTFVLPAGTTQQIARDVIRIVTQQVTARR